MQRWLWLDKLPGKQYFGFDIEDFKTLGNIKDFLEEHFNTTTVNKSVVDHFPNLTKKKEQFLIYYNEFEKFNSFRSALIALLLLKSIMMKPEPFTIMEQQLNTTKEMLHKTYIKINNRLNNSYYLGRSEINQQTRSDYLLKLHKIYNFLYTNEVANFGKKIRDKKHSFASVDKSIKKNHKHMKALLRELKRLRYHKKKQNN